MMFRLARRALVASTACVLGLSLAGCEGEKPSDLINKAADGVKSAADSVKEGADAAKEKLAPAADEAVAKLRETASSAAQSALDSLKSGFEKAKTKVASLAEPIKGQASALVTQIESATQGIEAKIAEFKTAGADKLPLLKDDVMKLIESAKAKLGDLTKLLPS
ncbi:MAG: hypothetical protein JNL80_08280 [Phycisphaerae bacterium]|jgi:hypothetical protein|nr:hypothetical protein [Phycisphaerae bacterium]